MKETTVKHLEFVQNIISRLSHKTFLVKSWSITAITALIAFAVDKTDPIIFVIGLPISLLFWFLDAHYLWLEQIFRKLYNEIRKGEVKQFSMNIDTYKKKVSFINLLFRPTVWPIYTVQTVLLVLGIFYFK